MIDKKYIKEVPGQKKEPKIFIFALSTCIWCHKTRDLLQELGAAFEYVDVDSLPQEGKEEISRELGEYNPDFSFPTILINNGEDVLVGFQEEKLRQLFS